jgi:hypothetical protein
MSRSGPRPPRWVPTTPATLLAACAFLLAGCGSRPRAPVLRDDPVYQNDREGFRFLAPEGWTVSARSEVPPGKAETEHFLVDYRGRTGARGAAFRVSLADLPASTDLAAYLAGRSFGVAEWKQTAPPEEVAVGSATGVRYHFSGRSGKEEMAREVVAVRRGERVYFFTALYGPKDTAVRDELRRVVESVIWKK